MHKRFLEIFYVVCIVLLSSTLHAGVILTYESQSPSPNEITYSIEGSKLRIQDKDQLLFFDGELDKWSAVDLRQKSYVEMTGESFVNLLLSVYKEEERIKIKQEIIEIKKANRSAPLQIELLGEKENYLTYECERYRIKRSENQDEQGCLIFWKDLGLPLSLFQVVDKLQWVLDTNSGNRDDHFFFTEPTKYPGLPAYFTSQRRSGAISTKMRLKSLSIETIPIAQFFLPEGLTKRDFK